MHGRELDCTEERDNVDDKQEANDLKQDLLGLTALGGLRYMLRKDNGSIKEKKNYKSEPWWAHSLGMIPEEA